MLQNVELVNGKGSPVTCTMTVEERHTTSVCEFLANIFQLEGM